MVMTILSHFELNIPLAIFVTIWISSNMKMHLAWLTLSVNAFYKQTNAVLDYSKRMIELFGLKEQGTGVKERDLQKQVLLKVLSCGLERSLSISAPQIPLGSKRLEL